MRFHFSAAPQTIFFGGGTPTALTTKHWISFARRSMTGSTFRHCRNGPSKRIPGAFRNEKRELLRARGVNRISLGVQSFDDGLLQLLGREHSAARQESLAAARGRIRESKYRSDVRTSRRNRSRMGTVRWSAHRARPDHISAYCLTYEEDTDFFSGTRGANSARIRMRTQIFSRPRSNC